MACRGHEESTELCDLPVSYTHLAAPLTACLQAVYLALCLTPVFLNIHADRTWSRLDAQNEVKPCTK